MKEVLVIEIDNRDNNSSLIKGKNSYKKAAINTSVKPYEKERASRIYKIMTFLFTLLKQVFKLFEMKLPEYHQVKFSMVYSLLVKFRKYS